MKTLLPILIVALLALAAPSAEAGGSFRLQYGSGSRHSHSGYHQSGRYDRGSQCRAPYVVSTCEIGRCRERRISYDRCGHRVCSYVTVVTYLDRYSDGRTRTYTRTFNA